MRHQTLIISCVLLLAGCAVNLARAQRFGVPPTTTNAPVRFSPDAAEIVKLVQQKTPEETILAHIKANTRSYDLSGEDMLRLFNAGVPPVVVAAMVDHDRKLAGLRTAPPSPAVATDPSAAAGVSSTDAPSTEPASAPEKAAQAEPPRAPGEPKMLPPPPQTQTKPPPKPKRTWTSSVIVETPPPPPRLQFAPDPPGPEHVWVPGNWAWRGGQWVWQDGYWLHRPRPGMVWVNGHWARHGRGYIWVQGRWR